MKKKYGLFLLVLLLILSAIILTNPKKESYAMTGYFGTEENAWEGFTGLYIPLETETYPGGTVNVEYYGFDRTGEECVWTVNDYKCEKVGEPAKLDYAQIKFKEKNSNASFLTKIKDGAITIPETVIAGEEYVVDELLLYWSDGRADYYGADAITDSKQIAAYNSFGKKYIKIKEEESIEKNNITIESLNFDSYEFLPNEDIHFNLVTTGTIGTVMLNFSEKETNHYFSNLVYVPNDQYYANNILTLGYPGEYSLQSISITDPTTGNIINFGPANHEEDEYHKYFDTTKYKFIVKGDTDEESEGIFTDFHIKQLEGKTKGSKVNITYNSKIFFEKMILTFEDTSTGELLTTYIKHIYYEYGKDPYFVIPATAVPGTYKISTVLIYGTSGEKFYYKNGSKKGDGFNNFECDDEFVIEESEEKEEQFNNRNSIEFSSFEFDKVKDDLYKLNDEAIITVYSDLNPVIDKELFDIIKGTKRKLIIENGNSEWIFNGREIINPKTIDVSLNVGGLNESSASTEELNKIIDETKTYLLKFKNNGNLPGKALIRLSSTSINRFFDGTTMSVYYYDENNNKLDKVALELQAADGYYEFYINHNSTYVLSKEILKNDIVSEDESMLALNKKVEKENNKVSTKEQNTDLLITILIAAIVIIIIIIVIILTKKEKNS